MSRPGKWHPLGAATAAALIASGSLALYSDALNTVLSRWEGDRQNTVYADKLADGLPTVCRGITPHTTEEPVIVGDYWSPEKCAEVERLVVERGQIQLAQCLPPHISQGAFDALSSMAHNVGTANVCSSRAVGLMWAGQYRDACRAIAYSPAGAPVWSSVRDGRHADGSVRYRYVPGLHRRRLAEMTLCLADLS